MYIVLYKPHFQTACLFTLDDMCPTLWYTSLRDAQPPVAPQNSLKSTVEKALERKSHSQL